MLSYAIVVATSTSVRVDTFTTSKLPENELVDMMMDNFDIRLIALI